MSTLETSIVFTFVLLVLSGLIVVPAILCADTAADSRYITDEVLNDYEDLISPERLNTFFTGLSENYRIIYGSLSGEAADEEE
ncbi:MAG: hypothetical protein J6O00_02050 [Clostridiales bacterium]|nr:hypothetical protein [Clostridiales bacterium]